MLTQSSDSTGTKSTAPNTARVGARSRRARSPLQVRHHPHGHRQLRDVRGPRRVPMVHPVRQRHRTVPARSPSTRLSGGARRFDHRTDLRASESSSTHSSSGDELPVASVEKPTSSRCTRGGRPGTRRRGSPTCGDHPELLVPPPVTTRASARGSTAAPALPKRSPRTGAGRRRGSSPRPGRRTCR
jgi:hypothetical protein